MNIVIIGNCKTQLPISKKEKGTGINVLIANIRSL